MWAEKHGKTWRVRDVEGGKKVTLRAGLPTKSAADLYMTNLIADRSRGDYIDPRGGKVTLGHWLDTWWPLYSPTLKPSALDSAEGILRRYIRGTFGSQALKDIDPLAVQQWTAALHAGTLPGLRRPLSAKTVANAHGVLHKVLSAAVKQRLIRHNPADRTGLPEKVPYEARFLTEQEAERLLAAMPDHYRPLLRLLLSTGLRWSEAAGLKAGRVDVLAKQLTVIETMQERVGSGELVWVTPKSRMSRRTVTFPGPTAAALIPLVASKATSALVFTGEDGRPIRYRIFRKQTWIPAVRAAGIGKLRLHDLRHTHASWLISAGVPLTAIQRRLGHASIQVTSDLYGHLLPVVDEGIMRTLEKALPDAERGGNLGENGGGRQGLAGVQGGWQGI
jgi:integrase